MAFDVDVAVIGVGAIGSMAAWRLTERGLRVRAFEQFGVPHHRGASAGQTRRIAPLSLSVPELTPTLTHSRTLWRELERATGRSLYVRTGGLILGPADSPSLVGAIRTAEEADIPHEVLEPDALRARFGEHLVRDTDRGLVDDLTGYLRPELGILAAVEQARRGGAVIDDYATVTTVRADDSGVTVDAGGESVRARHAVLAPGAWAGDLLPITGTVVPRLNVQAWYLPRVVERFRPPGFPVFERVGDIRCYGFPTVDGATVKIGISTLPHPEIRSMAAPYPDVTSEQLNSFARQIARYFPGLHPTPVTVAPQPEGYTLDGQPLVGPLPDTPRIVVACGFSGAGYKSAPVTGELIADLVTDGESPWQLARFDPAREILSPPTRATERTS